MGLEYIPGLHQEEPFLAPSYAFSFAAHTTNQRLTAPLIYRITSTYTNSSPSRQAKCIFGTTRAIVPGWSSECLNSGLFL